VREAVRRAGIDGAEVEDLVLGCATQQGSQGYNIGRLTVVTAGLPASVAGMTIDRKCASGLMAIATAAKQVSADGMDIVVAGGVESISLTQNKHLNTYRAQSEAVLSASPNMYVPMIETAEVVAARYGISRDAQDRYALQSQQRVAAAYAAGRFEAELVPLPSSKLITDKASGATHSEPTLLQQDEGYRADTTLAGLAKLEPVWSGGKLIEKGSNITAGNASQLSDGAAAAVLMDADLAARRGLPILGRFRGLQLGAVDPAEMSVAITPAIRKLMKKHALSMDEIDLWELHEAYAVTTLYNQRELGTPWETTNVNGGAIALGHPYGMSGVRYLGQTLMELGRRGAKKAIAGVCTAGGMSTAVYLER
jgi:acetyl-CoA C-acetyltransferase